MKYKDTPFCCGEWMELKCSETTPETECDGLIFNLWFQCKKCGRCERVEI